MSDAKPQQEPSMEEILASIRRIIAEDETPGAPAPPAEEPKTPPAAASDSAVDEVPAGGDGAGEVLHLTEAIGEDGKVKHIAPPVEPVARLPDGRIEPGPPQAAAADDDIAMVAQPDPLSPLGDRIVSTAASGAAAAAFARLAAVPRETLRPLLQTWLDENLPELVERLVRAEIARVVDEAGLR
jgi:cell pole-organizing protein PopZ